MAKISDNHFESTARTFMAERTRRENNKKNQTKNRPQAWYLGSLTSEHLTNLIHGDGSVSFQTKAGREVKVTRSDDARPIVEATQEIQVSPAKPKKATAKRTPKGSVVQADALTELKAQIVLRAVENGTDLAEAMKLVAGL